MYAANGFASSRALVFALATVLAVLPLTNSRAEKPADGDAASSNLRVVSYNVQFLPGPAAVANERKNAKYRARTIGQKMAAFDIVCLNEVFDDAPRNLLLDQLKKAWGDDYQAITGPKPMDNRVNGGLAIASRLPFVETHSVIYTKASSPKKYGFRADGFAAKGVLHARVRRSKEADDDDYLDVFVTHMEARVDEIRLEQYPELAAFVAQHSDPRHPVLILGDFNTRGDPSYRKDPDAPYHLLFTVLDKNLPTARLIDSWASRYPEKLGGTNEQESSDIGHRIDYVFLANPEEAASELKLIDVRVNGYLDPKVVALSDHSAVEAELHWTPAKR